MLMIEAADVAFAHGVAIVGKGLNHSGTARMMGVCSGQTLTCVHAKPSNPFMLFAAVTGLLCLLRQNMIEPRHSIDRLLGSCSLDDGLSATRVGPRCIGRHWPKTPNSHHAEFGVSGGGSQ